MPQPSPTAVLTEVEQAWADRYRDRGALLRCVGREDVPAGIRAVLRHAVARFDHDLAGAVVAGREALALLPDTDAWRVRALLGTSACLAELGLRDEALVANEQALRAARVIGSVTAQVAALHDRAGIFEDDPGRCEAYLRESLRMARAAGERDLEVLALLNLAELLPDDPVVDEDTLARSEAHAWAARPGLAVSLRVLRVGRLLDAGQIDAARALAEDHPPLSEETAREAMIELTRMRVRLATADGRPSDAVRLVEEPLADATPYQRLYLLELLGSALEAAGDLARALSVERSLRREAQSFYHGERTRQGLALEVLYASERSAADAEAAQARARALAGEVARLEAEADELRDQSFRDALTGLFNRRHLADLAAALRGTGGGEVAVVDLDGFKALNDELGHAAGDVALAVVADLLREVTRGADVLVRFGGDEFCVIRMEGDGAPLADELVLALAQLPDRIRDRLGPTGGITASIGVAGVRGDLDAAIAEADRRMYSVKRARRRAPDRP